MFSLKGVDELVAEQRDLEKHIKSLNSASYQLYNVPESEKLKKPILAVTKKYEKKLKTVNKKLEKIQESCQHGGSWIYIGRDSHYDHEQCAVCGWIDYKA